MKGKIDQSVYNEYKVILKNQIFNFLLLKIYCLLILNFDPSYYNIHPPVSVIFFLLLNSLNRTKTGNFYNLDLTFYIYE